MDGDIRPPSRRPQPDPNAPGLIGGYSATIPADLGHPQDAPAETPVDAHAEPGARKDPGAKDRQPGDDAKNKKQDQPEDKGKDGGDDDQKADNKADNKKDAEKKPPMSRGKKILYALIALCVLAALVTAAVLYWLHARHFENTDDAFVDGYMSQVAAQVPGKVIDLKVTDNQLVRAGQPLLQIEPRDYQAKLDSARAQRAQAAGQLDQARAALLQRQADLDQSLAQVRVSEAELGQQQSDLARFRAVDPKAITRQQLDTTSSQTKSAAARLDAARQAVQGMRAQIEAQKAAIEAGEANVQAADAAIATAALQLSYTTVVAPQDGRVTRRTVNLGNYANAGQALLAVVPDDLWITANFKETQLAHMQANQPVDVTVDACPGRTFPARVQSFQSGTGAVFSSLPAENATGNYVKVVQRVPVKIVFDTRPEGCRLAMGMSVEPRVTVRPLD